MLTQNENALFEAPAAHEASHYSHPYSNPEMEDEWETHEASHYSNHYSNPEMEDEWETHEASHYSNPYSNPELEDEGEYFFKKAFRGLKSIARVAMPVLKPLAKRLAPIAAKALVGMIPGVGAVAAPLAGKLVSTLLRVRRKLKSAKPRQRTRQH
jgi:hypothetical protein